MAVTLEDCKKIIQRYSNRKDEVLGFNINPLGDTPMGFLGDHFKLNIRTLRKPTGALNTVSFFLKTLPQGNENHLAYVLDLGVFKKEALLYKNLLMDFQKLHRQPIAPQCYLVKTDSFIVLQDLSASGYSNQDDELDLIHCRSMITTMAHFHASSIIFEEKRSVDKPYRINDHYKDELREATFVKIPGHPREKWARNTSKAIVDSIKFLKNIKNPKLYAEKIIKLTTDGIYDYITPSKRYRNVITHADLWKNNVMFKKTENSINSLMIDFQLARYVPCAFDILTTLYINCTEEFLEMHFKKLLDLYYETFSGCLKTHNIDPEQIMSQEDFLGSIGHYTLPALLEATMFATIVFVSPELSNNMLDNEIVFDEFTYTNRSKYVEREYLDNPYFRKRYINVLKQFIQHLNEF